MEEGKAGSEVLVELIVKSLPHSDHISNWDFKGDTVWFTWRGDRFEVSLKGSISANEVQGASLLIGGNKSILLEALLTRTWTDLLSRGSEEGSEDRDG